MKKLISFALVTFIAVFCFAGCDSSTGKSDTTGTKITTLVMNSASDQTINTDGTTYKDWVKVKPTSFDDGDVVFVSADPTIAKIATGTKTVGALWFEVTGVSGGETVIYAQSKDGTVKSEEIKIKVSSPDIIETLKMNVTGTQELSVGGDVYKNWVKVTPMKYNADKITFVSSNPAVATVTKGTDATAGLWFEVSPVSAGTAKIYAQNADGSIKSDELTIVVRSSYGN